ncbi:MAG: hypothetical protein KC933_09140 [Myxococcales bacterium]|nr:hypothetical protein [Myxococcales bacterium]
MHGGVRPKARSGLLTSDHSKRGRRYVIIQDPEGSQVTLLEPWEHAVLVLADGSRTADEIAELLQDGVEGEAVTRPGLLRCLKYFERQELIESTSLRPKGAPQAGPRTLANIQEAYREWHQDPGKTGRILAGYLSPFDDLPEAPVSVGLTPTVALPEREDGEAPAPVAVGTTLVLGSGDDAFADGDRAMRSILEAREARTEVGLLHDPDMQPVELLEAGIRVGGAAASGPFGDDDDEPLDDLELGNVADLLAAVDDDFQAMESAAPAAPPEAAPRVVPPVGKAVGGVAEIPGPKPKPAARPKPARQPKRLTASDDGPATAELVMSPDTTQRLKALPETALTPTVVGRAPDDGGDEPVIISPARNPSGRQQLARVGAVIGPEPSPEQRNVTAEVPAPPALVEGATVEDTQRFDLPTDVGFAAHHPVELDSRVPTPRHASVPPERSTSRTTAHLPDRARSVFERLWAMGVEARSLGEATLNLGDRRRRQSEADQFQRGLERLTAGELELALTHFMALEEQMPTSERVVAFAEAIRAALDQGLAHAPDAGGMLQSLTAAVEDAVAHGRCPRCLGGLEAGSGTCPGCGFTTRLPSAARAH